MKSGKVLSWIILGLGLSAGFYYTFWPDISKYFAMCRQQHFLEERLLEEDQRGQYLKKEQESLSKDPVQIERVAREKLGLSRPRDIIYKFEEDSASQQVSTAVPKNQPKPKD